MKIQVIAAIAAAMALIASSSAAPAAPSPTAAPMAAEPDGPLAAAKAVLAALGRKDGDTMAALMLPEALVLAQTYKGDGTLTTRVIPVAALVTAVRDRVPEASELMFDPVVQVERDLAHVWTPYTFDLDGKRSHCGIDSFGLARIDGKWRITSLTWTNDPASCAKWGK